MSDLSRGVASFAETEIVVKGRNTTHVKVPYTFPSDPGDKPRLAYCVFEAKGLVTLPEYKRVPVEERVMLTEQKQSEHFLFCYRPDSCAAANIEQAIKDREEAYLKLKGLLHMDLPDIVIIDLYSDHEAKGLGSGTTWTPANTVTNTHIAEVYNESYRIDSKHELARIVVIFLLSFLRYSSYID